MIQIIYGAKGSGKTKRIIDQANDALNVAKGNIVFITDTKKYSSEITYKIRFVNTKDFEIVGEETLLGFIKGMIAGNHDIEYFFIDGAARIACDELKDMASFYEQLESLHSDNEVKFVLTVSADIEDIPDFIKKYI